MALIYMLNRILDLKNKFIITIKSYGIKHTLLKSINFLLKHNINNKLKKVEAQNISLISCLSFSKNRARVKAEKLIEGIFYKKFSIRDNYFIKLGTDIEFQDQQVVLLAHWDPQSIVDPYVVYMAQELKKINKKIILCSANKDLILPKNICLFDAIIIRTCNGYDFTSWKAAFEAFPSLYKANEITFCNDSVFGPIGSYTLIYHEMKKIKCDFWGLTINKDFIPHLQSFYLVFRTKTIQHNAFKQFINSIALDCNRANAINYELRLSLWLELNGLIPGCFRPYALTYKLSGNLTITNWDTLLQHGIPIIKRELFKSGNKISMGSWEKLVNKFGYKSELITNYFYRLGIDISTVLCIGHKSKKFPPSVLVKEINFNFLNIKKGVNKEHKNIANKFKIAVFIHCYYLDGLQNIFDKLFYLSKYADIFISTDTNNKKNYIKDIANSCNLDVNIEILPNRGYDIAAFICGFKEKIFNYDIVLKIHNKKSPNLTDREFVEKWRSTLFNSLLGTEEHINLIITLLYQYKKLGMLLPPTLPSFSVESGINIFYMQKFLKRMGIKIPLNEAIDFSVGSMFWARTDALKPLFDLNIKYDKFEETNSLHRDGRLAHVIERLFVFSCCKAGFHWGRIAPAPYGVLCAADVQNV